MIVYQPGESIKVDMTCEEHGKLQVTSEPLKKTVVIAQVRCPFPPSLEYATQLDIIQRHPIDAIVAAEYRSAEAERERVLAIIEKEYPPCTCWRFWKDLKSGALS